MSDPVPDPRKRASVSIGALVDIVQKADQRSGKRTRGTVAEILTSSPTHPFGIKVRLSDGNVGRVKTFVSSLKSGK